MENKSEYTVKNEIIFRCKCGHKIGKFDGEFLLINDSAVRSIDAVCLKCGQAFHWHITDRMLEKIVAKVLLMRHKTLVE